MPVNGESLGKCLVCQYISAWTAACIMEHILDGVFSWYILVELKGHVSDSLGGLFETCSGH